MPTDDNVWIDRQQYRIVDRALIAYPLAESPEQRKARGDAPVPTLEYTVATIERVRDG